MALALSGGLQVEHLQTGSVLAEQEAPPPPGPFQVWLGVAMVSHVLFGMAGCRPYMQGCP